MLSTKIRTAIIASSAVAALAASAAPASALIAARPVGSITQTRVLAPTAPVALKEAGSAGVPGYDDATCEGMLRDMEVLANNYSEDSKAGNKPAAEKDLDLFRNAKAALYDNCLVVD
jgi:hypothetical protein